MRASLAVGSALLAPFSAICTSHAQTCQPYWASLPRLQLTGSAVRYAAFDDGAGPEVYAAQGSPVQFFRWRNQQWQPLPSTGLPATPTLAMGKFPILDDGTGPAMYVLLRYGSNGSVAARWRNGVWTQMSAAFWQFDPFGRFFPLGSVDLGNGPRIYGSLPTAGHFGRWNGQSWDVIGAATAGDQHLYGVIGYDDGNGPALHLFGDFQYVNGIPAWGFAKWNGQSWSSPWPEQTGSYSGTPVLTVFDHGDGPKLYCDFAAVIGGVQHDGLHRWDGAAWEFLGGPDTSIPEFWGLHALDDGTGPGLYITGRFSNFAGQPAQNLVRYDAQGFHAVPGSNLLGGTVGVGVIHDARGQSLVINTNILNPPSYFQSAAQLVACPSCPADCDANGRLNVLDFMCFMNAYAAFDPFANVQPDGVFNILDFMAFMDRFAAGCP